MFQSNLPTAVELARYYGVGSGCIIALYLVLKFRPWERKNGNGRETQRLDALGMKVVTIESKVDILWSFLLRRSISEGLAAGTLTRESPLRANVQILDRHHEVIDGIQHWYNVEGKQLSDLELFIELERRFNVELHHLCETEKMMDGACLAAMLFILRPNSPLFQQYNVSSWHDVA